MPPRPTLTIAAIIMLAVVGCGSVIVLAWKPTVDDRAAAASGQPPSSDIGGALLRIDPKTNRVVKRIPLPGANMVAAGLGSVWVTGTVGDQKALMRISPASTEVQKEVALEPFRVLLPSDLAVGEGAVWIMLNPTGPRAGGQLIAVDPATSQRRDTRPSLSVLAGVTALYLGLIAMRVTA